MAHAHLQQFKEDFILLAEAGFIAINQGDGDAATKLFKAAQLLEPENVLPKIGFGYLHLCMLELKQAAKFFEEALAIEPHNEMVKSFLGLSLSLNPKDVEKGEKVLVESAQESKDPMVKGLVNDVLNFVEKYVKKAPSPAELAKPKSKQK